MCPDTLLNTHRACRQDMEMAITGHGTCVMASGACTVGKDHAWKSLAVGLQDVLFCAKSSGS